MDKGYHTNNTILSNYKPAFAVDWSPYKNRGWTEPCDTRVPLKTLKALGRKVSEIPSDFKLHSRVEKVMAERRAMADGKQPLDWGMGEILAYATLLNDGYGVRLSGEDTGRGTFSHRHAVLARSESRKVGFRQLGVARASEEGSTGVRGDRFGARRKRRARVRVWLRDIGSEAAGDLGGAVRRLRQRRAGGDRSIHRCG
jgi:2-oxoglutarate dehydrogenase complex dehydrogenase (E1) component-like enzyme